MPDRAGRPLHGGEDVQVLVAPFETLDFLAEDEFLGGPRPIEKEDVTRPWRVGGIPQDRHHRRDPDAARDEDDAVGVGPHEGEGAERAGDIDQVSDLHMIM